MAAVTQLLYVAVQNITARTSYYKSFIESLNIFISSSYLLEF